MVELTAASVEIGDAVDRVGRVRRGRFVVLLPDASTSSSLFAFGGLRVLLVRRVLLVVAVVVDFVGETVVLLVIGSLKSSIYSSSLMSSSSCGVSDTGITAVGCVGRVGRVRRGFFVVLVVPLDSIATPSMFGDALENNSSADGVGRVRRVRRGRTVVVVVVDKFIISTVKFARIISCISFDGLLDGVGRVRLVRFGRNVVLVESSVFHTSYASASVSTLSYSTLAYVSPKLSSSATAAATATWGVLSRDLLICRISWVQKIIFILLIQMSIIEQPSLHDIALFTPTGRTQSYTFLQTCSKLHGIDIIEWPCN